MARYWFHLRDGSDELLDPDGIELADMEAIKDAALGAARDTLSHDIKEGRLDLRYRLDVEDASHNVIYSLPFDQAFEIHMAENAAPQVR